jgi:hypothetical protein
MSDAANTSAAAHQDELLLVAEKLGELSDRFARIESEFTAQTAPIETSKANLDATVAALNAVLTGIKALDSHVLSNDLGSVSKRVEQVELSAKAGDEKIAGRVTELADAVEKTVKEFHRQLAAIAAQKTELGKRVESEADAMRQQFAKVGSSIATAREELAKAIEAAKTQFATPVGLNPMGDWKANDSYGRLDVVTVNGTSYVAIRATDEKPSARARDWQVLARRGGGAIIAGGGSSIEPASLQDLTDEATITWDLVNPSARVTLGGNRLIQFRNERQGGTYVLTIVQDGAGGRTLTWPANVRWPGSVAPILTTTAGRADVVYLVAVGNVLLGSIGQNYTL